MEGPGMPHERVHISIPMCALIRVHGKTTFDGQNPLGRILV